VNGQISVISAGKECPVSIQNLRNTVNRYVESSFQHHYLKGKGLWESP